MKKTLKKSLIAGAIFTAALNVNGCAYGPAPTGEAMRGFSKTVAEAGKVIEKHSKEMIVRKDLAANSAATDSVATDSVAIEETDV